MSGKWEMPDPEEWIKNPNMDLFNSAFVPSGQLAPQSKVHGAKCQNCWDGVLTWGRHTKSRLYCNGCGTTYAWNPANQK
eukprot:g65164.t1